MPMARGADGDSGQGYGLRGHWFRGTAAAIIGPRKGYAAARSFRPPVSKRSSWEGFHGGWPMRIVEELAPRLPDGFVAEPRVHLGSYYEIDVCTFEQSEQGERVSGFTLESNVGIAAAPQALPAPTLTLDAEFPERYA